jgi:hypothetical protein
VYLMIDDIDPSFEDDVLKTHEATGGFKGRKRLSSIVSYYEISKKALCQQASCPGVQFDSRGIRLYLVSQSSIKGHSFYTLLT